MKRRGSSTEECESLLQLSSCSLMCAVLPLLPEADEEEEFISEVGELMRGGDTKGRREKGGTGAQVCDQSVRPLLDGWRRREEQEKKFTDGNKYLEQP